MASNYLIREAQIVRMYRVLAEQPAIIMDREACETALALAGFPDDQIDALADEARDRVRMIQNRLTLARAG